MSPSSARRALCMAACLSAIGCAGPARIDAAGQGAGTPKTATGEPIGPEAALALVAVGKSTKADISTALGDAIIILFDSGYEVWVYRWSRPQKASRSAPELVVLFRPSGVVERVRLRPEYVTPD